MGTNCAIKMGLHSKKKPFFYVLLNCQISNDYPLKNVICLTVKKIQLCFVCVFIRLTKCEFSFNTIIKFELHS